MASVNFEKIKSNNLAKAMFRHCDKEERLNHEHSNKDIDKSKTNLNRQTLSYTATCSRYDEHLKHLDNNGNKNKRKDRVSLFGLNIPVPRSLDPKQYNSWFNDVNNIIATQYGNADNSNIIGLYQHYDEVHEYTDATTKLQCNSRVHEHIYIIPERDAQLNGKWFSSKANMMKLNKSIDTMSLDKYNVKFMDGSKKKSYDSVESLKNKSLRAENERLEKENVHYKAQNYDIKEREKALDERELKINHKQKDLDKREEALVDDTATFNAYRQDYIDRLQKSLTEANRLSALYANRLDDIALANYCKTVKYKDGKTALDKYLEFKQNPMHNNDSLLKFSSKKNAAGVSIYDRYLEHKENEKLALSRQSQSYSHETPTEFQDILDKYDHKNDGDTDNFNY